MDTSQIKVIYDRAAACEREGRTTDASQLYLECARLVVQLLHMGAERGVPYGDPDRGSVPHWFTYLRKCINNAETLWRHPRESGSTPQSPSPPKGTQRRKHAAGSQSVQTAPAHRSRPLRRTATTPAQPPSPTDRQHKPSQRRSRNTNATLEQLRREHEQRSMKQRERDQAEQRIRVRQQTLREVYEDRARLRAEPITVTQEFIDSVIAFDAKAGSPTFATRAKLKATPLTRRAVERHMDEVLSQDSHPVTFRLSSEKSAMVRKYHDEEHYTSSLMSPNFVQSLLRDTRALIENGMSMLLAAYPEFEVAAQAKHDAHMHQHHHQQQQQQQQQQQHEPMSQLRARAATLFTKLGRSDALEHPRRNSSSGSGGAMDSTVEGAREPGASGGYADPVDKGQETDEDDDAGAGDDDEWDVNDIVQQKLEAFVFDESVWATLRLLCSEDMHVKEARLRAKCEAYLPVPIQESLLEESLRLLPDPENPPQGFEPYAGAISLLHHMPAGYSPAQKAKVLCDVAKAAVDAVEAFTKEHNGKASAVSCDVLLNIMEHVVLKSGRFAFIYEIFGMQEFIDPSLLRGQEGFILCSFAIIVDQLTQEPQQQQQQQQREESEERNAAGTSTEAEASLDDEEHETPIHRQGESSGEGGGGEEGRCDGENQEGGGQA